VRNEEGWRPSKYQVIDGAVVPTMNAEELGVRSRLGCALEAPASQKMIQEHARGVLADLGCGKVPYYELYRPLVSEVICIDWSGSWHGTNHVDIEADLNEGVPLPNSSVDTVMAISVIEHLREPATFFREVRRVLRANGKLIVNVPFLYWLHEEPHDYYRYTQYALRHFCDINDLNVVQLQSVGGPLAVILDIVGKNTPYFVETFQRLARWFLFSSLGRRIDERNHDSFPLGYFLVAQK
jgi:SAM-dependent methyltransferase